MCDFLRDAYTDTIRPYAGVDLEVTRRWYRVGDDAPTLPFPSTFLSEFSEAFPYLDRAAGFVWPSARAQARRLAPPGLKHDHVCGTAADFAGLGTFDPDAHVVYDDSWVPECCGRDAVCVTQLCAQEHEHDRPAAQLRSYPIAHQDATGSTPVVIQHWGLNLGDHAPAWAGYGFDWYPAGEDNAAARQLQVIADENGQLQFQTDVFNFGGLGTIAHTINAQGIGYDFALGGAVGSIGFEFVGGVLTLVGSNFRIDPGVVGLGTAAYEDIGTSGRTVPLLDGVNFWASRQFHYETTSATTDTHQNGAWTVFSRNTPAAGFGGSHGFYLSDTGGGTSPVANDYWEWINPTAFATTARRRFTLRGISQEREYLRVETSGNVERIGFFGAAAVPRPSGDIGAALVALGLMTAPTTPVPPVPPVVADLEALAHVDAPIAGDGAGGLRSVTIGAGLGYSGGVLSAAAANALPGLIEVPSMLLGAGAGLWQSTGAVFTIPSAGTWLIAGHVRAELSTGDAVQCGISVQLRNEATGVTVPLSEAFCVLTAQANLYGLGCGIIDVHVTVTAPTTYRLFAMRSAGAWTTSRIRSDANGRSVIRWHQLAGPTPIPVGGGGGGLGSGDA